MCDVENLRGFQGPSIRRISASQEWPNPKNHCIPVIMHMVPFCFLLFVLFFKLRLVLTRNFQDYFTCIGKLYDWLSASEAALKYIHDDVIKWKHFPRYRTFVWGIHRSLVNPPHKGQWRGTLIFSLICAWTNGWVINRDAGDLRRHHAHNDVTVMIMNDTINRMNPQITNIVI